MRKLELDSIVSQKREIVAADMEGETVMMSIETGSYYSLGKIGGIIWGIIEKPVSVETVIEKLLEKYEVTREQCESEVLTFLNKMNKEGLLEN